MKFRSRDRPRRHDIQYRVLRPDYSIDPQRRRCATHGAQPQPLYFDDILPGLGKNVLRESRRIKAIEVSERALRHYALYFIGEQEEKITIPGSAEIAHEILAELMPDTTLADRQELIAIEETNAGIVQSKAADDSRGERLFQATPMPSRRQRI